MTDRQRELELSHAVNTALLELPDGTHPDDMVDAVAMQLTVPMTDDEVVAVRARFV